MPRLAFLSILIAMALLAATASTASATPQLTAGDYPVALQAHSGERKYMEIVTEPGSIVCEVKYRGEISEPSPSMTLDPSYANCEFTSLPAPVVEVDNTGCVYVLHPNEEIGEGEYSGSFDLKCETGKALKARVFSCQLEIKEQTGLGTVKIANRPAASPRAQVAVDLEVESLTYTVTKDPFGCQFMGTGTRTEGEIISGTSLEVSGHDPTHPAIQVGIDLGEGEGEEEPAPEAPEITAASYPVAFASASPVNEVFAIEGAGGVKQVEECETTFQGEAVEPSSEIGLMTFEQSGCAAANTGECFYRLGTGEPLSEDSYAASLDIVCPGEGAIEFPTESSCRITVPEQDALLATVLTNNTGSSPRDIGVTLTVKDLYSYDMGCGPTFDWKVPKLNGELTIEGLTLDGLNPETLSPVAIEVVE
jgi:hypothetical protein